MPLKTVEPYTLKRVFFMEVTDSRDEKKWEFWAQTPGISAQRMTGLGSRLTPGADLTGFAAEVRLSTSTHLTKNSRIFLTMTTRKMF